MRTTHWVMTAILGLLLTGCAGISTAPTTEGQQALAPTIPTIDFASDQGPVTHRASGFFDLRAPLEFVTPLTPQLYTWVPWLEPEWKKHYDRAQQLGVVMQTKLGSSNLMQTTFGGAGNVVNYMPGDNADWSKWDSIVQQMAQAVVINRYKTQYDIWNEPDIEWAVRSYNQYLEMWQRTVLLIRSIDPNAVIVGPSSAGYAFVQSVFLPYAKANNVLPNILSWHHFKGIGSSGKPNPISDLSRQVYDMRNYLAVNRIPISDISLNEYQEGAVDAGELVQYLYELEKSQVEAAARACWPESKALGGDGNWGCWKLNNFLNVSGTPPESGSGAWKPRSIWWAMKGYGDITGRLVRVTPASGIYGVAGFDRVRGEARMVLGRVAETAGETEVLLTNLSKILGTEAETHGKVYVEAEHIKASGFASSMPVKVLAQAYSVSSNGELRIKLPNFGTADAYTISVRNLSSLPPPSPSPGPTPPPPAESCHLGDRVQGRRIAPSPCNALNVRFKPGGEFVGVQPIGAQGTLVEGPVTALLGFQEDGTPPVQTMGPQEPGPSRDGVRV